MATTKFYFDTRRAKAGKPSVLKIAIGQKNTTSYVSLDAKLLPEQWDAKEQKVKKHPDAMMLTAYVHEMKQKLDSLIICLVRDGKIGDMTANDIRDAFMAELNPEAEEKEDDGLFVTRFRKYVASRKASTVKTYNHTLSRMKAWKGEDAINALRFEDITKDWLTEFNLFLAKTSKSQNGRNIHFRNLRAIYNDAIDNNIVSAANYPFRRFKIKSVETAKRSLMVEELRRLFFFKCEEHQEKYVDMFKLSFMLMGVNIIDLANLTEIQNGRLNFNRSKTGHLYQMKVEPEAMALIEKHRGTDHLLFILDHWVNDEFFRRKMNKELQKVGPMHVAPGRGGKKVYEPMFPAITSYWARHTWATIADELEIPDKIISEGLGHEHGNRVTNIYIRRSLKKVDDANRKVLDWVLYGKIGGEEVVKPGTPEFFGLDEKEALSLGLCKPQVKTPEKKKRGRPKKVA